MDIYDIKGWSSYHPLYEKWVREAKDICDWVEVGVFEGRGLIGGALEAQYLKKDIRFYAVDTWEGSPNENEHKEYINSIGGPDIFYNRFISNIERYGVDHLIWPIRKNSVDAAKEFENNVLDIVYIDAAHDRENIHKDINAWLPKIKIGGILAGHDYNSPVVKSAVHEMFNPYDLGDENDSWIYRKVIL